MGEFGHRPWVIVVTVLMVIFSFVQYFFNALSGQPNFVEGVFLNSTASVSDKYVLEITPAGATFSIWGVIYTWQIIWMIYCLTLLGRKSSTGYLYVDPEVIPVSTICCYILSEFINVGWLFLWDRQFISASFALLLLIALTLYTALILSHRQLHKIANKLIADGMKAEIWMVRFFLQNGIAFYATWCTVATLLNLGAVISYRSQPPIDQSVASTACLSILSVEIITWFTLDIVFLDKYVRYNFSPYLVLVASLTGVIAKNWRPGQRNPIFTAVLLSVAILALVIKISTMIWRHVKRPLYSNSFMPSKIDNA